MSLLTIAQNALLRIGLPRPDFVASSTDFGVQMMCALLNEEGNDLAQQYPWQALTKEHTFHSFDRNDLPEDFAYWLEGTFLDKKGNPQSIQAVTPARWQQQGRQTSSQSWRIRGNQILLQNPQKNEEYVFEYISKNWVSGERNQMTSDSDRPLLEEELLTLGGIWRYLKAKGLDYSEAFQNRERRLANTIARDGTKTKIQFGQKQINPNIPEGNWKL